MLRLLYREMRAHLGLVDFRSARRAGLLHHSVVFLGTIPPSRNVVWEPPRSDSWRYTGHSGSDFGEFWVFLHGFWGFILIRPVRESSQYVWFSSWISGFGWWFLPFFCRKHGFYLQNGRSQKWSQNCSTAFLSRDMATFRFLGRKSWFSGRKTWFWEVIWKTFFRSWGILIVFSQNCQKKSKKLRLWATSPLRLLQNSLFRGPKQTTRRAPAGRDIIYIPRKRNADVVGVTLRGLFSCVLLCNIGKRP